MYVEADPSLFTGDPAYNCGLLQGYIDQAWVSGIRRVFLRAGFYPIEGQLDCSGVYLCGVGAKRGTTIVQTLASDTVSTVLFRGRRGDGHAVDGGLQNICIDSPVAAGIAVEGVGDNIYQPDNLLLQNVRIGGGEGGTSLGGTFRACVKIIGTARTHPLGIRGLRIQHLTAFRSRAPAIVLWGIQFGSVVGVGVFTGATSGLLDANHGYWVGGTASVPSNNHFADHLDLTGPLNLTFCPGSRITGKWSATQKDGSANVITSNVMGT